MNGDTITGEQLRGMILAGAAYLEQKRSEIDALNVFPVPDGDTGTNMSLTMKSAVKDVNAVTDVTIANVAAAVAKGALKGARGNSGVILSQLFRGFASAVQKTEKMNGAVFAMALKSGADMAYKSMMRPKEGTILTVARVVGEQAIEYSKKDRSFAGVLSCVLREGRKILEQTPEMLPVLKMAGVVDAGGYGLLTIYTGFSKYLNNEDIAETPPDIMSVAENNAEIIAQSSSADDIKYGYCTELFVIHLNNSATEEKIDRFRAGLEEFADCVLVISDYDMIKVHAHSNEPNRILQRALELGEITNVKIENMREQNRELLKSKAEKNSVPPKKYGVVAVAIGSGIEKIFRDLCVDEIIQGGQTMNPSTQDILTAINNVNAEIVYILPNNSNIILSAEQTKQLTEKVVHVIPTKSIPQGISAMLGFNIDSTDEENIAAMTDMISAVKTGQVTYAVRDSVFGDVVIKEGDIIGLFDGKIVATGHEIDEVSKTLLQHMVDENSGLVSMFVGESVSDQEAGALKNEISRMFTDCEIESYRGQQPIYYYIFSVE